MTARKKRITLAITNDPNYDQRMIRICTSLHDAGYDVTLVGRRRPISAALIPRPFRQVRIPQRIDQGKLFYALFNAKLFFYLLFKKTDAFCAIDLDTIMPVYWASLLRRKPRVYDAHELFCDIEEVASRPRLQKVWRWIERTTVPNFHGGYTVNESYVREYRRMYGVDYAVVRNATVLRPFVPPPAPAKPFILYQGAVNKGRCFEQLIPAMKWVDYRLVICGNGNFMEQAQALAKAEGVEDRVEFRGYVPPEELRHITPQATIGITLFVATSLSNELSLANRFFDYMHAGVPQLCVAYPEYEHINSRYEIATLIRDITPESIAQALNGMLQNPARMEAMRAQCMAAREEFNWQAEERRLLGVYEKLFNRQ